MYHCRLQIYFTGRRRDIFRVIREMSPLEGFTHDCLESDEPEAALAARADLILADLRELPVPAALETLCAGRRADAQQIGRAHV